MDPMRLFVVTLYLIFLVLIYISNESCIFILKCGNNQIIFYYFVAQIVPDIVSSRSFSWLLCLFDLFL